MKRIRNSILLFCALLLVGACIDRLHFDAESIDGGAIVVQGSITTKPGPYTVKLSQASNADDNLFFKSPISAREVILSDDVGNVEKLTSEEAGTYHTSLNGIQGVVGRKYSLRIELVDGSVFESIPDEMKPVGHIDSLYYQFESRQPINMPTEYGFHVYIDAQNESDFVRWRFTGTFKADAFPQYHSINNQCKTLPDPPPCSGFTQVGQYEFIKTGECTCCTCWVSDGDEKPRLNDETITTNGTFKKIEMAYIPFDALRFQYKKYMLKVEQMSLSREAYEFWKLIRDQKDAESNIFQPAIGKIRTNFVSTNSDKKLIGIFYASAIEEKILFITGANPRVPYPEFDIPINQSCFFYDACDIVYNYFYSASRTPPPEWE